MATPYQSPFMQQDEPSTLESAYRKASSTPPVSRADLETAYKPYELKLGQARKGTSDRKLYSIATERVVAWWKRQQDEAKKAAAAAAQPAAGAPSATAASPASAGQSPAGTAPSGPPRTSSGATLPNTAMGTAPIMLAPPKPFDTAARQLQSVQQVAPMQTLSGSTIYRPASGTSGFRR